MSQRRSSPCGLFSRAEGKLKRRMTKSRTHLLDPRQLSSVISHAPHSSGRSAARITDSSSRKVVSFSSACTMNRFPSSRCASATKIVCPLELIVETQPQLQPASLRLSATISHYFTRPGFYLFCFSRSNDKMLRVDVDSMKCVRCIYRWLENE